MCLRVERQGIGEKSMMVKSLYGPLYSWPTLICFCLQSLPLAGRPPVVATNRSRSRTLLLQPLFLSKAGLMIQWSLCCCLPLFTPAAPRLHQQLYAVTHVRQATTGCCCQSPQSARHQSTNLLSAAQASGLAARSNFQQTTGLQQPSSVSCGSISVF